MAADDLHPVIQRAVQDQIDSITGIADHPGDYELWMELFEELVRRGYTWDSDDLYEWTWTHWPKRQAGDDEHLRNEYVFRHVMSFAMMAAPRQSGNSTTAHHIVDRAENPNC